MVSILACKTRKEIHKVRKYNAAKEQTIILIISNYFIILMDRKSASNQSTKSDFFL